MELETAVCVLITMFHTQITQLSQKDKKIMVQENKISVLSQQNSALQAELQKKNVEIEGISYIYIAITSRYQVPGR